MTKTISMTEFTKKMEAEDLDLLDVRETEEFASGHLPGAVNFPLSQLANDYSQLDLSKTYYVMCQMGGRSARACEFLNAQGFKTINVEGGIEAWRGDLTTQ